MHVRQGVKQRARRYALALGLASAAFTIASSAALASTTEVVTEPGTEASVASGGWVTAGDSGPCLTAAPTDAGAHIPGCGFGSFDDPGSGVIDLTPTVTSSGTPFGQVVYDRPVSASLGLSVSFDEAQLGGSGGEGLSFFLVDGSHPFAASSTDGMYGYGPRLQTGGVSDGLMGVSLDTSGAGSSWFADGGGYVDGGGNGHSCGSSAPGPAPDAVVLRAAGDSTIGGYCYVAGTSAEAVSFHGSDRLSATHHVEVDVSPSTAADPRVIVKVDETTLIDVPTSAVTETGYPGPTLTSVSSYRFGFGASESGVSDHHDIWNVRAETEVPDPPVLTLAVGGGPLALGSTGSFTLVAATAAPGGVENTPMVATAGLPAGVTVAAIPTGTGWECSATVVGSRAVSCTYAADSIAFVDAAASAPTVTVAVAVSASAAIGSFQVSGMLADENSPAVTATSAGVDVWGTGLNVVRSASRASYTAAGQPVWLTYTVTNQTGGVVTGLAVADTLAGASAPNCPQSSLASGGSETCTASYATTQADVDAARTLWGTGSATAVDALSHPVTSVTSTGGAVVAAPRSGVTVGITSKTHRFRAGQTIVYTLRVANTGTTTVHRVGIATANLRLKVACPATSLAPLATTTCTAFHRTTPASVKAGKTVCRVIVGARDPAGARLVSPPASLTIRLA
jgi:hypothetical protein